MLGVRLTQYQHNQRQVPPTSTVASLLSYTLYMKRFFPYYCFNLCCGLDENGDGVVYGYDAIGSYESHTYGC